MKILLFSLNHHPEQTGIGKYQGEMAEWFVQRGHEVRIITAPPYYPNWKVFPGYSAKRYQVEEIAGAKVYRVPLYVPAVPSGLKRLIHQLSFAVTSFPVAFWLALTWHPEVVVVIEPPLAVAPTAVLVSWLSGGKAHLHVQDFEVDAAFQLGLLRNPLLFRLCSAVERGVMRLFSAVSSISPKMCEKLYDKGVPKDRIHLIPNWANVDETDPILGPGQWRSLLGMAPGAILALYSGNIGRKQGLETVVEAARSLAARSDILFVICGDGAAREEIMAQSAGLPNIRFLPVQPFEDFRHLMIAADVHMLPQKAEAADLVMPSKLGNILASSRPVVVGAVPGTQLFEAIQNCGLAVPPDDAQAFAQALVILASDPDLRTRLGQMARERALSQWTRQSILQDFETRLMPNFVPAE